MRKRVYVQIYDQLRKMLDEGVFPVGAALPTEPKLAQMMGTSRMTLRQALDLLHEDGLIEKVHGSGNYVKAPNAASYPVLNKMGNPIDKCLKVVYDRIETEHSIEVSNDYNLKLFSQNPDTDDVRHVSVYLNYYSGSKLIAYTYSAVSLEVGEHVKDEEWVDFLRYSIYETARRSYVEILPEVDMASLWPVQLGKREKVFYMNEKIYDEEGILLVCNKHYLLADKCHVSVEAEA